MKLDSAEIDLQVSQLLQWCKELKISESVDLQKRYKNLEKELIEKLTILVVRRCSRYRKFSNHPDLTQDGLEGLCLALKTYDPSKGSFIWWANKYIGTRVARAANQHSTIRIPIAKAGLLKPMRTIKLPLIYDPQPQADEQINLFEFNHAFAKCLDNMSDRQQALALLIFQQETSREEARQQLDLTRGEMRRLYKSVSARLQRELSLWAD